MTLEANLDEGFCDDVVDIAHFYKCKHSQRDSTIVVLYVVEVASQIRTNRLVFCFDFDSVLRRTIIWEKFNLALGKYCLECQTNLPVCARRSEGVLGKAKPLSLLPI